MFGGTDGKGWEGKRGGRERVEGGEGLSLLAVTTVYERLLGTVLSRCLPREASCVADWDMGSPGARPRTRDPAFLGVGFGSCQASP